MKHYSVTIKAFGHVSVRNVDAPTPGDAKAKALRESGIVIEAKERA